MGFALGVGLAEAPPANSCGVAQAIERNRVADEAAVQEDARSRLPVTRIEAQLEGLADELGADRELGDAGRPGAHAARHAAACS